MCNVNHNVCPPLMPNKSTNTIINSLGEVICDSGNIGKTPVFHFIFKCLFIWLDWVLVAAHRIFVVSHRIFCCDTETLWLWHANLVVAHGRLSFSTTSGILLPRRRVEPYPPIPCTERQILNN